MKMSSFSQATPNSWSVYGKKHNRCAVLPAGHVDTNIAALERIEHSWFVRTNTTSDLTVNMGKSIFHLHKFAMASRSGYLNRLVFQRGNNGDPNDSLSIHIGNLPGGSQIFQLVVKFCYGLPIDLTAANVAPLYCTARLLEMTEEFVHGNLISKADTFISFVIFSSWKDTITILKSCEGMSLWVEDSGIVKKCSESIAWKACLDPQTLGRSIDDELHQNVQTNKSKNSKHKGDGRGEIIEESWWFADVSVLKIDHFVGVINAVKAKGMKPKLVGGCIAYWTSKWLKNFKLENGYDHKKVQGDTFESLIRLLPDENNSVCCNFLLHILKVGSLLNIDCQLTMKLERRVARMLESCTPGDIIVRSYKEGDTVYDVNLVIRVVEAYVTYILNEPMSQMHLVARVVDDYLALVARDENLSAGRFQLLAEALPENARQCDDKLYRAIDMYLKAHPTLTEEERAAVCKMMEFHKLSQEARKHAMKNGRLPFNITARLTLWEQVNMTRSILSDGFNYRRSQPHETVGVSKGFNKKWFIIQNELQKIKRQVESMKLQLSNLQVCSLELQSKIRIGPV